MRENEEREEKKERHQATDQFTFYQLYSFKYALEKNEREGESNKDTNQ